MAGHSNGGAYVPQSDYNRITATDSNGTYHNATFTGLSWFNGPLGGPGIDALIADAQTVVNVKAYGAIGDGTTNDQDAIELAIDALDAAGGGILWFPAGVYLVDPNGILIGDNTWVQGAGPNTSVIQAEAATTANGAVVSNRDKVFGNTFLRVTDITIRRLSPSGTFFNHCVFFDNCTNIWIQRNQGWHVGAAAPGPAGERIFSTRGCRRQWITDNFCLHPPDVGIGVAWLGSPVDFWQGDAVITNNVVVFDPSQTEAASGILCTVSNAVIAHNILSGPYTSAFEGGNTMRDVLFEGNVAYPAAGLARGFIILGASGGQIENIVIRGNIADISNIDNDSANSIVITAVSGGTHRRIVIENNPGCLARVSCNPAGGSTFRDVRISGRHRAVLVQNVDDVVLDSAIVSNPFGDGFRIESAPENLVVSNCTAHDCLGDGFEYQIGGTATPNTFQNCVAYNNGAYGFNFEQPQNVNFLDCSGWNNTSGLLRAANVLLQGPTPFLDVRFKTNAAPTNFYANPGSTWYRTDGNDQTVPLSYVKATAATVNTGWLPVQPGGHGGDTASVAGTMTLPAGKTHRITGTETVTSVTATYASKVVVLVASGDAFTLNDGGNLRLSASWATPAANSTLTLECDGTGFNEMGRSAN